MDEAMRPLVVVERETLAAADWISRHLGSRWFMALSIGNAVGIYTADPCILINVNSRANQRLDGFETPPPVRRHVEEPRPASGRA